MTTERILRLIFPNGVGTRAMLAGAVVLTTCGTLAYMAVAFKSEAALTALVGLAGTVIAWYFARRDESTRGGS